MSSLWPLSQSPLSHLDAGSRIIECIVEHSSMNISWSMLMQTNYPLWLEQSWGSERRQRRWLLPSSFVGGCKRCINWSRLSIVPLRISCKLCFAVWRTLIPSPTGSGHAVFPADNETQSLRYHGLEALRPSLCGADQQLSNWEKAWCSRWERTT